MKEIRNKYDVELRIETVEKAKNYFVTNENDEDSVKFNIELNESENLEEIVNVLNKYSDLIGDGSEYYINEY